MYNKSNLLNSLKLSPSKYGVLSKLEMRSVSNINTTEVLILNLTLASRVSRLLHKTLKTQKNEII